MSDASRRRLGKWVPVSFHSYVERLDDESFREFLHCFAWKIVSLSWFWNFERVFNLGNNIPPNLLLVLFLSITLLRHRLLWLSSISSGWVTCLILTNDKNPHWFWERLKKFQRQKFCSGHESYIEYRSCLKVDYILSLKPRLLLRKSDWLSCLALSWPRTCCKWIFITDRF